MALPGPARSQRPSLLRWRRIDFAPAVVIGLLGVGAAVGEHGGDRATSFRVASAVLAAAAAAPLVLRRRYPVATLVAVETAFAPLLVVGGATHAPSGIALAVAMFTVAARFPRSLSLRAAAGLATVNTLILLGMLAASRIDAATEIPFVLAISAGSWALGDNIGTRRAYLAALEERAARLEREQRREAERAVIDERARIARELHDVVAHHVSAIAVQAGAAEELAEAEPSRARDALRQIQGAAREALAEMRTLVGVLRNEEDAASLGPQPGLAQVDRLASQTRSSGLDVRVRIEGSARSLPAAVDLSAFRILQEALTNTLRHARAAHADVVVRYGDEDVELLVSDDGHPVAPSPDQEGGRGLVGMRERVALFGGRLEAGPAPSGGFRVHAVLPTGGSAGA